MLNVTGTNLGLAGSSNSRLQVTSAPTMTNYVLPYVVVGGADFGSYIPTGVSVNSGGIGALNQAGYAGYSQSLTNSFSGVTSSATSNLKVTGMTATVTGPGGTTLLNALNMATTGNTTLSFGANSDILNLTAGALLRSVVADGLEHLPEARLLDAITNLRHGDGFFFLLFRFFFVASQFATIAEYGGHHRQHAHRNTTDEKHQQENNNRGTGLSTPEKMQHDLVRIFQRKVEKHHEKSQSN
jgi:hypothetical protein